MKNYRQQILRLFLLASSALLIYSLAIPSHALKSDREQPADIEADDIEFDFKKGTRTYTKNVLAIQGTLRLKADKLFATYKDSELEKATMWGTPARFKQRPDDKPYDVEGSAKEIIVDQTANTLTLIGKATIKQGPDTARGETIVYNMANDTLRVKGGAKLGTGGKNGEAKPQRKIADPFADVKDEPEALPDSVGTATQKARDAQAQSADTDDDPDTQQEVKEVPARSGRSRLIIQPK